MVSPILSLEDRTEGNFVKVDFKLTLGGQCLPSGYPNWGQDGKAGR